MFSAINLASLKSQVGKLKKHTLTVYYVARDPRTPFIVRALAVLIAAYALSPIDLIPDFIPVIGYLDDLLLVALGLALVVRLTPSEILHSAQLKAEQADRRPVSYPAAFFIVVIWIVVIWLFADWVYHATK
jgi:uncharacterized membrane protein YkvA (DUF1232 family)